jgi:hypothetical protein
MAVRGPYAKTQKASYVAATVIKTAVPTGTTPFGQLFGSSTKIIRIQKVIIHATVGTAAVYGDVIVTKRAAIGSGGTMTAIVPVAKDSNSGATTVTSPGIFTGAPTAGTGGGVVAVKTAFCPITGTVASGPGEYVFNFANESEQEPVVLRTAAEGIELSFATTPTNAPTVTFSIEYTEEAK